LDKLYLEQGTQGTHTFTFDDSDGTPPATLRMPGTEEQSSTTSVSLLGL
jgi:hypothetical protein